MHRLPRRILFLDRASLCLLCPRGKQRKVGDAGSCSNCAAGKAPNAALTECLDCQVGKFTEIEAAPICNSCPAGKTTVGSGAVACTECAIGKYADTEASALCKDCAAGKWSEVMGRQSCDLCDSGMFRTIHGNGCTDCPAGYISVATGAFCSRCLPGRFSDVGESECGSCRAGQHSSADGRSCLDCLPGTYTADAGAGNCTLCQAAKFVANRSADICTPCPPRTWTKNLEGSDDCVACNINTVYVGSKCEECKEGRYALLAGESFFGCRACPKGGFCPGGAKEFHKNVVLVAPGWWLSPGILQPWTKVNAVTRQTLLDNAVMQIVRVSPQNLEKSMMSVEGSEPS